MDFYLENINQFRYRNAITKLRVSSHALEIERGRHCGLSVEERICGYCHCIEDEKHFLFHCSIVKEARLLLNTRIRSKYSHYTYLNDEQKMFFLFTSRDPQLLSWIGKFIYFALRQRGYYNASLLDNRCSGVKKWNDSFKFIRHSQNWDLSHDIIIIVLLEWQYTKTIACHLFAEISRKNNRFYMLQDNKCVLNCLYFYIRTYTDVFYMYRISFRFNVYVYISVPIYVLSWLWILVLIAVFFVSNLMYCFFLCFVRNDEINKLHIYI